MNDPVVVKFSYTGDSLFNELSLHHKQKVLLFCTQARKLVEAQKVTIIQNARRPFKYKYERKWVTIEFSMDTDNIPILTNIKIPD
ncbi:MAG: hypothetical protein HQM14_21890 [SAR324 cluster bacterium]|nr:hypothetical protein [SAR324 cluster bacterium]